MYNGNRYIIYFNLSHIANTDYIKNGQTRSYSLFNSVSEAADPLYLLLYGWNL